MDFDLPDTALAVTDGVCAVGAKYDHANIAPSNIENLLKESPLVGHALVWVKAGRTSSQSSRSTPRSPLSWPRRWPRRVVHAKYQDILERLYG